MKVGFIGLGIMGYPMAEHLAKEHELSIHTRTLRGRDLEKYALKNAREVAKHSKIIFIIVPQTSDVESVLFSSGGVVEADLKGKIVVDMSSISPIATKAFAKKIRELGGEYLDAPVSGGEIGAKNASLSIMVGGSLEAFNEVLPLFKLMGKNITHVGKSGDGQIAKVANQIIVALNIEAVAEALNFAIKAGADAGKVREALLGGFASSKILEIHGERMIKEEFKPGFKIKLHQKDLDLALNNARELGIYLPSTALAQQLFNICVARGMEEYDHSALFKALNPAQ